MDTYNQRAYSRGQHLNCDARVSRDGTSWVPADIHNVSSGGLKLDSPTEYQKGEVLWFDLVFHGFLSDFEVKAQGEIRHVSQYGASYHYGVAFIGLSPDTKIRIDENVKLDRPVSGGSYHAD